MNLKKLPTKSARMAAYAAKQKRSQVEKQPPLPVAKKKSVSRLAPERMLLKELRELFYLS